MSWEEEADDWEANLESRLPPKVAAATTKDQDEEEEEDATLKEVAAPAAAPAPSGPAAPESMKEKHVSSLGVPH